MSRLLRTLSNYSACMALAATLIACAGDPMESGMDPFAPMVFKEGSTKMPESPPNKSSLLSFYVSPSTIFKFSVDTQSISIGADGVTRYIVVITNPSGEEQAQYEGIRCDSYQWKLYGNFENGQWKENPLAEWRDIKMKVANRYQAALAQGAFCNFNNQEQSMNTVMKSLNPNSFTGGTKPSNSNGVIIGY
ncbi:CNP1-like family protein [Polynucleobacter asymbioticus]|uniref:CNP1-like uncharacterized domain-containing protein n=1 Tax=Polynucleobacter asymbioticus TaxID=576611 RepID=A0AAC9IPF7_9BURK|nr:CNP1-like family protein [Polynucleobacter asymbioticus]APB98053.1 hypothetical protein A4F89_01220 [Polynucleobacter asymbioticus]APC00339.1 hypothetical protein AOC25_01225 [Polynucleobacter asymbioticus]